MDANDLEFFVSLGFKVNEGFGSAYNTFCCEQAILISSTLRSKDKILEFSELEWDLQKKIVPGLDDGHSGNTFVTSWRLAIAYLPMLRDKRIDDVLNGDK